MAAETMPCKGKTAYFVFSELHRKAVREELQAGKEEGAKVNANLCLYIPPWSLSTLGPLHPWTASNVFTQP